MTNYMAQIDSCCLITAVQIRWEVYKHIYFDLLNALIIDKKKDFSNFDKDKFIKFEHF